MARILIVEDELHLAQGLLFNLEAEGHEATAVENGEAALETLMDRGERFDAVVLDVMLPGLSGFDVAERLRAAHNYVPILMLTARSRPEDVLKGFATGADDYLPKPFELSILLARVHGLLRRMQWQREQSAQDSGSIVSGNNVPGIAAAEAAPAPLAEPTPHEVFRFDGRTLDFHTLELTAPAGKIQLTLMEAALLRYFIEHRNQNVSRKHRQPEISHHGARHRLPLPARERHGQWRRVTPKQFQGRPFRKDQRSKDPHLLTAADVGHLRTREGGGCPISAFRWQKWGS